LICYSYHDSHGISPVGDFKVKTAAKSGRMMMSLHIKGKNSHIFCIIA